MATESLLTLADAELRFKIIQQDIDYKFFYNFKQGDTYHGFVEVAFGFNDLGIDAWLDFEGKAIDAVWINGESTEPQFQNFRVVLPHSKLRTDQKNIVRVQFTNLYSKDGNGLQGYTDNENKQYLYTQSEPFYGNKVVPLFDQPDLKATFELFAVGPNDWNIVTGEVQKESLTFSEFLEKEYPQEDSAHEIIELFKNAYKDVDAGFKFFRFATTQKLSTYLNNIVGGPYVRYDAPQSELYKNIPMAVYCRANLAQFVENQLHDIFAYHAKGIEFYEKFFSFDYPFSKCDVIFCAEFTVGAMEYPGAITYSEQVYFYRKMKASKFEVSNRGRVILHELAHMWFGNTVTMKWWNDLWLNESFADFSCFEAWEGVKEKLDFDICNGWIAFLNRKDWAFKEDQERTTHPISCEVNNTEEANHIFDGITYPKGAMLMRQLMILVGKETFSKGLGQYFNKFAWKNTVLSDLLESIKLALGENHQGEAYDIDKWKESFLDKPGMNMVTSEFDANKPGKLIIKQTAANPDFPTLRYHKICVGFFDAEGNLIETKEVLLNNSEITEVDFNPESGAKAVLLNQNDWAFVKIDFDTQSYDILKANFHKLDNLSKALFARSRYDAVRDARISAEEFIEVFFKIFENEKEAEILQYLLNVIGPVVSKYIPSSSYSEITNKLFNIIISKLTSTDDFDTVQLLKGAFNNYLYSEDSIEIAKAWYEGTHELSKHELNLREKWSIVLAIHGSNRYSTTQKALIYSKACNEDNTDTKLEFALKIDAMTANKAQRSHLFTQYISCDTMSFKQMQYSIAGFVSKWVNKELKQEYFEDFFENFMKVKASKSYQYFLVWSDYLFPSSKDKAYLIKKIKELLPHAKDDSVLTKTLLQTLDEEERAAKVLGIKF